MGKRPQVIAIANQKGGVAKTSTAVNLSYELGRAGRRVLLIDMDPQANASKAFGIKVESEDHNEKHYIASLLDGIRNEEDVDVQKAIVMFGDRVGVIPAGPRLRRSEGNLHGLVEALYYLKQIIDLLPDNSFDYVITDSGPSDGPLTKNTMTAADHILIPVETETFSVDGCTQTIANLKKMISSPSYRSSVKILGILPTMYDRRKPSHEEALKKLINEYPHDLLRIVIPTDANVENAIASGAIAARRYAKAKHKKSPAAEKYALLAQAVIKATTKAPEEVGT